MTAWTSVLLAASPLLVVALGALLLMLAEALGRPAVALSPEAALDAGAGRASELGLASAVVLFVGAVFALSLWLVGPESLPGARSLAPFLIVDRYSAFFSFLLCLGAGLSALLGGGYLAEHQVDRGEFFPLLVWSTLGAMALATAGDLLTLFVALETMSLGVYAMVGLRRTKRSIEASLKYFLLGGFAGAVMLFGAALLYGATGCTDLVGIGVSLRSMGATGAAPASMTVLVALTFIVSGLAFKVAAVPFHMWTPDAYEGAPTPATAYMAVAVKSAAFAVLLRVLLVAFGDERLGSWGTGWPPVVGALAVATMTVANLVAGRQESVKRMLAYSSIAHAGYVLIGVVATIRSDAAVASVLFYLLAYTVSTVGAFGALILCGSRGKEAVSYEDLAGLGRRHPALALLFSVCLLSLTGIPATAGFLGKLGVFLAAIDAELYVLVVIGLVNSFLAAYYYLRVIVFMYMREPAPNAPRAVPMRSAQVGVAAALAALLVLWWGLFPLQLGAEVRVTGSAVAAALP